MRKTIGLLIGGLALYLAAFAAQGAGKHGALSVLALGPVDGRAVVQYQGKMKVLRMGDQVPGTKAKVVEVLPGKLVAEEIVGKRDKRRVMLWIFKANKPGAASRIQRFDRKGPKRHLVAPPKTHTVEVPLKDLRKKK